MPKRNRDRVLIYEVNAVLEEKDSIPYSKLVQDHMRFMLKLEGFMDAKWYRVDSSSEDSTKKVIWSIQYFIRDRRVLGSYFKNHAPRLRAETHDRFGERVSVSRRILELKER
jgi:hypothetical protein